MMDTATATTDWSAHYVKTSWSTSANTTSARTLYPPTPLSLEPDNSSASKSRHPEHFPRFRSLIRPLRWLLMGLLPLLRSL